MTKVRKVGFLSLIIGVFANLMLGFVKLAVGLAGNSVGILIDGINNFGDVLGGSVGAVGYRVADLPKNDKYPRGYGNAERVATMFISSLLVIVGFVFLYMSMERFIYRRPSNFSWFYFGAIALTMVFKLIMGIGFGKVNKIVHNDLIACEKTDSFLDVGVTAVTLIGYSFSLISGFPLDAVVGLAIGVFTIVNGMKILVKALTALLGKQDYVYERKVKEILDTTDGIKRVMRIAIYDNGGENIDAAAQILTDEKFDDRALAELKDEINKKLSINIYIENRRSE